MPCIFMCIYLFEQQVFEKNRNPLQYIQICTEGKCQIYFPRQFLFHVVHYNDQLLLVPVFIHHIPLPPKIPISGLLHLWLVCISSSYTTSSQDSHFRSLLMKLLPSYSSWKLAISSSSAQKDESYISQFEPLSISLSLSMTSSTCTVSLLVCLLVITVLAYSLSVNIPESNIDSMPPVVVLSYPPSALIFLALYSLKSFS